MSADAARTSACATSVARVVARAHCSSSLSKISLTLSSGCGTPGCSFNSSSKGYWFSRERSRSMAFFQSMTAGEREQVRVLLAVVIVDVRGTDAFLHNVEGGFHAFAHLRVARIEGVVQAHVGELLELPQPMGARKFVGNILQQNLDADLAGEDAQLFQGRKGGVELVHIELFAAHAYVLDQVAEWDDLRDFEGALDFIHHEQALGLHGLGDGHHGVGSRAAPDFVRVHGRMERVQAQVGIAEPVAQLGHLRLVAIVQVLAGAKDLHLRHARLLDAGEGGRGEAMIHEHVGR